MAEDIAYQPQYSAVDADLESQRQAREFRLAQLEDRRRHQAGIAAQDAGQGSVLAQAQQLEKLAQQARKIKLIVTGISALSALTIIGIIWTIVQLNIQMVFSIFKLPGEKFFGLPAPLIMIPVVILLDIIFLTVGFIIGVTLYALVAPLDVVCAMPLKESTVWWKLLGALRDLTCLGAKAVETVQTWSAMTPIKPFPLNL